ncbi:MAG: putative metallopeptidase [Nanoarchaeota archaeon]
MVRKKRNKKIRYEFAPDLQFKAEEISEILFPHIRIPNIKCLRSFGSSSRRTIARCHTLGKVMQLTIGTSAWYGIEFISERFDKMTQEDQIKTIIHELMHIPKSFGGGFKHHNYVCEKNVNKMYSAYLKEKQKENFSQDIKKPLIKEDWKNIFKLK